MGYSGDEIYQKVVAQKLGTEGMFQSKDQVFGLTQRFNEISDRIKQAAGKLEGSWKGNASGAAKRGAGPAGVVYSTMGESLDKAQDLTRAQAQTFDEVNPRIKPIPSVPAEPNGLTKFGSIIPGISDWTGAGEDVSNYDAAVASKQAAEANNVHHYQNLATATGYNVGNLPKEYGPQQAEGGQFSVGSGSGGAPLRSGGGHPMSVNPPATGGGGGTGGHASAGGGSSAPNQAPPTVGGGGGGGGQAVAHGPAGGAGNAPPPQVGTGPGGTGAQAGTNTAGYAPPPVDPSLPGGGTGTATPYGGSGGSAGTGSPYSGLGGGFVGGYNNSGGGSSRFGGGPRGTAGFGEGTGGRGGSGVGGGKGAGSEGGLKGGPRSGAGRVPAEEPSAGSGRGAAGAAGRAGASGMPMTGNGARKQDDKERSGAGYLITRENGQEIVGDLPPTAPPVIGEDVEPKRPKD
ncbi:hypothetical protein [Sciscionella sediminilitoris]|uniref:hypothetical protein n=1 Tax=Sciscionella sediminilitoris TaxID=1445613 RepID=UPI0004DF11AB|nr:hypothetical protein [Sciscionella sp. SE31]